jgi:hypothetical protein
MRCISLALVGAVFLPALASAQLKPDQRMEIGLRSGVLVGSGKPANDLPVNGLKALYRLDADNAVGLSIDRLRFDFERPQSLLGIAQDKTLAPKDIDAKARSTVFSVFYERRYSIGERPWYGDNPWRWSWNVGLGIARPDVDSASGPAVGGGRFVVYTDAGGEIVPSVGLGLRYALTSYLDAEAGLSLSRHIAKWRVTDAVSGRSAEVRSYTTTGLSLGLGYRF